MRTFRQIGSAAMLFLALVFFCLNHAQAQVDTTAKKDTVTAKKDTVVVTTAPATVSTSAASVPEEKRFVIYAGPNVSTLNAESDEFKHDSQTGFHVGLSWRTKGFLFSQFGLRYNNQVYSIFPATGSGSGDHKFSVQAIDIPLTLGINIISGADKVLGLRGFISAMPSFNIGVGDNDYDFDKDKIETFVFYGQLGLGVDVLFMVFEAGYNYGFTDLIKDKQSNPGQWFLNIGFRF